MSNETTLTLVEQVEPEAPAVQSQPVELLSCRFEGCDQDKLNPSKAFVPSLKAVEKALGRPVSEPADLAKHVFCRRHEGLARSQGVRMFSYQGSVAELNRRVSERAISIITFKQYGQMEKAFRIAKSFRQKGSSFKPRRG